ncbi:MAG: SoxR reducing system RseC family protein [Bacteroidia bacterium]|nr:SoxR reducing system RseC family protein [Bacteroidia bacterium]
MSENSGNIEHDGIVKSSDKKSVTVTISASSACAACHAEGMCSLSGRKEKIVEIRGMYNVLPGDNVTILMKQSTGYSAVFLGYVLPLILVVALLIILASLSVSELTAGIGALAILIPYYFTLYIFRNRINKKFTFTLKV